MNLAEDIRIGWKGDNSVDSGLPATGSMMSWFGPGKHRASATRYMRRHQKRVVKSNRSDIEGTVGWYQKQVFVVPVF